MSGSNVDIRYWSNFSNKKMLILDYIGKHLKSLKNIGSSFQFPLQHFYPEAHRAHMNTTPAYAKFLTKLQEVGVVSVVSVVKNE